MKLTFRTHITDIIWYILDSFAYAVLRTRVKIVKGVLVVRLDAIGDFIVWLDAARGIRQYYNDKGVTLICSDSVAGLAEATGIFEAVIPVNQRRFSNSLSYRYKKLGYLRTLKPDVFINSMYSRQYHLHTIDVITRFVQANKKIGFEAEFKDCWQTRLSSRWYTRLIPAEEGRKMELIRNAEFVRGLGASDFKAGIPHLDRQLLPAKMVNESYYILFPGAGLSYRCWPTENFAKVADFIYDQTGITGLICGGPGEVQLAEKVIHASHAKLENWIGKTNITGLMALIADAELLVTNETSAVHIAAATKTESVCILGGGDFERFTPYEVEKEVDGPLPRCVYYKMPCFYCNWNCIYDVAPSEPMPCISKISVASVLDEVKKVVDKMRVNN